MFLLSFFRAIKFSLQDISRNMWLSLVTIIILVLALFTINILLVVKVVGDTAINAVKEAQKVIPSLCADDILSTLTYEQHLKENTTVFLTKKKMEFGK